MPRRERCIVTGVPHHVTQRGVNRGAVFEADFDRRTYLRLLSEQRGAARVRVLGWCLMTNHVHLILLPEEVDSLALVLRRVHGRYAQYFNAHTGRSGHLWQNRYFACALGSGHVARALAYVDNSPVRARMVEVANEYPWSSARAHAGGTDARGLLDADWRRAAGVDAEWIGGVGEAAGDADLEKCTYAGRPCGDVDFVTGVGERFGRRWSRGRPKKQRDEGGGSASRSGNLFVG